MNIYIKVLKKNAKEGSELCKFECINSLSLSSKWIDNIDSKLASAWLKSCLLTKNHAFVLKVIFSCYNEQTTTKNLDSHL